VYQVGFVVALYLSFVILQKYVLEFSLYYFITLLHIISFIAIAEALYNIINPNSPKISPLKLS
jgi:hypothetical protein